MKDQILRNKKGIIFGALDENSIAWQVALACHSSGAKFVLTNAPVALRMGQINALAEKCSSTVIAADATDMEDINKLVTSSVEYLDGKIDFLLHSVGMSPNVRKKREYTDLNYNFLQKTIDVSALSFHKVLQTAWKEDALNDYASVVGLSYIAAQRTFPGYGDMAEAKATLESIARSFGYHYGIRKKVRVNTISQSPTKTTAGSGVSGFDQFFDYADQLSPLGNASAIDCANFCVMLFSDYTKMVTMQNLFHDGGFSSMGMSDAIVNLINKNNS